MTSYSAVVPTQVQAKASYKVQITKNASVYTSKGKKTKTVYKKDKVLTAYKVRKIKGKYYYDLGKGKYVRTSYAMKYYYRTTTQSKKLVRTIKLYQPKGTKVVKQNAYVKRTVKQNLKTKKKTYGKWGSASWKAYKAPAVSGYTASPKQVAKETVYSWSKNKTINVKYKKKAAYAKKYYYRTTTQSKKLVRTIKLYQPKGTKVVKQNAYVKRTVKQNLKTKKKTYGKWGSASWEAYKVPAVSGYTASPEQVAKETVYSWSKNKTVNVKYKKASKKPSSTSSAQSNPASPKGTASKPSASNSSASASTSSKTFSVDLINEQTIYDGDDEKNEHPETVYGVTYYKKSGNIFSNAGDDIIYQKTVTVTETAYDAKGNCYYKINEARDEDSAWILSTDTNKNQKSENTLTISNANFNVKRNKQENVATYDLLANNSLKRNGEMTTVELFEGAYYPVVCHVYATGMDKKGVEWYKVTIPTRDGVSDYRWVKANEFETTNQPEGHTHPTFEWTEYWQKKAAEDLLNYLNEIRAEAGTGAKPLTLVTDRQAELDALVNKRVEDAEKYNDIEKFTHTSYFEINHECENKSWVSNASDVNSVSSKCMEELLVNSFKEAMRKEKAYYDRETNGRSFNFSKISVAEAIAFGHYSGIINPAHTKVCISSAPAIINGKVYLVEYQDFW